MESEKLQMQAIVKGRVQGVGFRATTQYHAEKLGLRGYVKNLPDGSVEIVAVGDRETLQKLLKNLRDDVGAAVIENISVDWYPLKREFTDFSVIF